MSTTIQIRDVPNYVHSILVARAARERMSLSDVIKKELQHTAERPSMQESLEQIQQAKPTPTKQASAELVRELRDAN